MKNQTLSTVIALAGSKDAALFAAFADLQRAARLMLRDGNRNPFSDTLHDLSTMGKAARVTCVRTVVEAAYAAACAEWDEHKRAHPDVDGMSQVIALDARTAYDAAIAAAKDASTAKAAKAKAERERAAGAVAEQAIGVAPLARALNIADALAMLSAACAAGDEQALQGVESLAEAYFTVAEVAVA